jgi:hypothetical protein
MVNGIWSVSGLGDAQSKYNWNGSSFFENKAELASFRLAFDNQGFVGSTSRRPSELVQLHDPELGQLG